MSSDPGWSSAVSAWLFSSSWWPLLPFVMLLVVAAFVVAFVLLLYMISPLISPKPLKLNGAHVVVTGGSSGIGKCIAIECYKQGAFITLVARDEVVLCISVDVSKDYSQVESVIKQAQEKLGPVDMLVNCAGMSVSGKFEEVDVERFRIVTMGLFRTIALFYLGSFDSIVRRCMIQREQSKAADKRE
uniref:3-ketodihydrosphingosine reductase n=1 Tax=Pygocentrus nattereri TaxID=42514 RepID=A0AAR2K8B5_PYGNA